ncbi:MULTISPECIES: DsbC family protein [unclassified Acinetobacter]|uniref:DsbC family protein n=1 Tax=unclassified Acinetobacter TaxID=196816 RepID=UPI001C23D3FB|nr:MULTISPECIES: DsbC family protein [unclassified Acinetobacter]
MLKKTLIIALSTMLSSLAFANIDTVKTSLAKNSPNLKIENIQTTEMQGIYSGSMQGQVVYLNGDAKHLIAGPMLRIQDQRNLTRDLMLKQNSVDWKKLPLQDVLKSIRGTGKRQIAIFSDPNCPYCKQLEVELNKLKDVTIYTFILPLKPQSVAPSKQVYCESNPAQAWEDLIAKGIQPKSKKSCANPIERNKKLAESLGVNGTPAIIFSNGFKVMGAYPAEQIEQIFKEFDL